MKIEINKLIPWKKKKNNEIVEAREPKKTFSKTAPRRKPSSLKPINLRQAVLVWLAKQNPTGIGINVPTRFSKFQADVAAFWSYPLKKKIYSPYKTVTVEIRPGREECWPDFSKQQELLKDLVGLKERKREMEEKIKKDEPEIKDNDVLFNEFDSWRFKDSKNKNYQKCLRDIEKIEHSIYKGSRFEQIRRSHVADNLYIAVPGDVIHPDELADGWGLIFIDENLSVKVVKNPDDKDCTDESRMHLAQTISASASRFVLHSQGVNVSQDGKFFITAPPHRRRKTPDRPEL
jgi:hypothetical protein